MLVKQRRFFNLILFALDGLTLILAYFIAYVFKWGTTSISQMDWLYLKAPLWMIPLVLVIYFFMEVYSAKLGSEFRKEMLLVIRGHAVGMIVIYSILYLTKMYIYSRVVLFTFGVAGLFLVMLERYMFRRYQRHLRRTGQNLRNLLVIGAGKVGQDFARKVVSQKDMGYNLLGFLDDDENKKGTEIIGRPVLGRTCDLPGLLESNTVDEVVAALPLKAYKRFREIVEVCEKWGIRLHIIPDYFDYLPGRPKIEDFEGIPMLKIRYVPLDDPFNRFIKRLFDIIVSFGALMFLLPVLVVIALGVKLSSPGPVFYKQERLGLNNKPFNMLKFRSMRVTDDNSGDTRWTTFDDPRKTWFGTLIRKTSLDELPQFINVLKGDMSVVGPRPERPFFVDQFKEKIPKYMVKHQVKPGITGWAQVNGWRGDTSIDRRIEHDIYYIENWDLLFDIKIMFMTVYKGLINKNAY